MRRFYLRSVLFAFCVVASAGSAIGQETQTPRAQQPAPSSATQTSPSTSTDIPFVAHDGVEMFGRLVLPSAKKPRAIVLYVQTAEGATIDQKRPLGGGKTFNYFDLYRVELVKKDIGFFSYEGRGIRMGDAPPRYEKVDRTIFNTGTLDNKVKDVLSAVAAVRKQPGLGDTPIFLMGASEGTLLAVEAASRDPSAVQGVVIYAILAWNMKHNFDYICSDGAFLNARPIDKDKNGQITKEEWDSVIKTAGIENVDKNGDGMYTVSDARIVNKVLLDAIENNNFDVLNGWAKTNAAVAVPDHWFDDHFAHGEMWTFLEKLKIPIGIFHGDADVNASMAAVKELERKSKAAGLANVEFQYFEGLDHSLNIPVYFVNGTMPAGHQAIFRYIDRIAPRK